MPDDIALSAAWRACSLHCAASRLRDVKATLSFIGGGGRELVCDLMPSGTGCVPLTGWLRASERRRAIPSAIRRDY